MPDDLARAYALDDRRVAAAIAPWRIERVAASTVRAAVEVALARPGCQRVLARLEPRIAGAAHLAATATLHLSYYAEDGVDHAAAAAVVRALADALRAIETDAPAGQRAIALDAPAGRAIETDAPAAARAVETDAPTAARRETTVRPPARRALPTVTGRDRTAIELRVNRACNERCRFCNTPTDSPTIVDDADAVLAQIAAAGRAGCRDLLLSGRETTLEPRLPDYLAAARAAGITTRRVQTNGTTLHHPPLLARLVEAGLNVVEMSLHTLDEDTFEALIGPRALLAHATAGLDALAGFPAVHVTLVIVLTTRNATQVPALIETVADRWPHVRTLVLSPVAPVGDGAAALDLLLPYDVLGPIVAAALRVAAARGLTASVPARCGLPPCTLPADVRDRHDALRHDRGAPLEPDKHKPPPCSRCALDGVCAGAWSRYLERHGTAALVPV